MVGFSHLKTVLLLLLALFQGVALSAYVPLAANDILLPKNGNRITGEVKKLERGVVHIDADYGDNIFIIDWEEVE